MNQPHIVADHEDYVRAVIEELAERDVRVSDVHFDVAPDRRATMKVSPLETDDDESATNWGAAEWITLRWSPAEGWVWQVKYHGDVSPRAAIYFGMSAVPKPAAVAEWLHLGLAQPMVIPSREDDLPFTTPDLDEALRAYSITTEQPG
ncbi:hypothetical protein CFP75_39660 [Amycolatopsis alba DSM 44262]|uniref:Uncharacterized protein n=1 Tax=Amycolatopsis alba DSM 44262 TaxID=1125972 RepID=A0A229R8Y7_AMYAL|nr:DUF6292 family protein [Amycolatopsis alba]OXM43120.1 hypothetical protein CFP75_39660 [Amycolatopsis alba DSM 44262]